MRYSPCLLGLLAVVLAQGVVAAAPDDDAALHSPAHDHAPAPDDAARHRPGGAGGHVGHAHPGISLSHPIIVESPLPETKLRLNYSFGDGDEGASHVAALEGEYAFTRDFSIEAVLPYVALDPNDGASADRIGDAVVAFKLASHAWVDRRILPAVGVEVVLPTGDEERGIGSDHVLELEPFVRVGYWSGPLEFIATAGLGVPLNQTSDEADEEDFALEYGLSTLYRVAPNLQALLELHGESTFGAQDVHAVYVSPGVTFQPFADKSINVGVGMTLPVTDDREFDYAVNVMAILHL